MKVTVRELTLFSMFGALMYASKVIMEFAPNIHLLGVFIITFTVVYRRKALYPIYIYVLLNGMLSGFSTWWIPYLYVWTVLWGVTMLLPKRMPKTVQMVVYCAVNGLHGFSFGILYAPAQAWINKLSFQGMCAWIISGFPFDVIHGISNIVCGVLIVPFIGVVRKLEKETIN